MASGVTLRDQVQRCDIRKDREGRANSPPNRKIPATMFRPRDQNAPGKIKGEISSGYTHEKATR